MYDISPEPKSGDDNDYPIGLALLALCRSYRMDLEKK